MGIKNNIDTPAFGLTIPDAYIKFSSFRWSSVDNKAYAAFTVWATETAELEGLSAIDSFELEMSQLFPQIQAQVYAELKKHPDFINSVDVP